MKIISRVKKGSSFVGGWGFLSAAFANKVHFSEYSVRFIFTLWLFSRSLWESIWWKCVGLASHTLRTWKNFNLHELTYYTRREKILTFKIPIPTEVVTGNFHFRALPCARQKMNTTQFTLDRFEPPKSFYHLEYIHIPYIYINDRFFILTKLLKFVST